MPQRRDAIYGLAVISRLHASRAESLALAMGGDNTGFSWSLRPLPQSDHSIALSPVRVQTSDALVLVHEFVRDRLLKSRCSNRRHQRLVPRFSGTSQRNGTLTCSVAGLQDRRRRI